MPRCTCLFGAVLLVYRCDARARRHDGFAQLRMKILFTQQWQMGLDAVVCLDGKTKRFETIGRLGAVAIQWTVLFYNIYIYVKYCYK